jgi:hypothetical protein
MNIWNAVLVELVRLTVHDGLNGTLHITQTRDAAGNSSLQRWWSALIISPVHHFFHGYL